MIQFNFLELVIFRRLSESVQGEYLVNHFNAAWLETTGSGYPGSIYRRQATVQYIARRLAP